MFLQVFLYPQKKIKKGLSACASLPFLLRSVAISSETKKIYAPFFHFSFSSDSRVIMIS
jgi:hypothetical protein